MKIEVHVAMQDANDINSRARQPKENNMRSGGIFFVARANIVAWAASSRLGRYGFDCGL